MIKWLLIGLIALGVIFAALGALYLARTAAQLPAVLPGHQIPEIETLVKENGHYATVHNNVS